MYTVKNLWAMFDVWNNSPTVTGYTKRAALRLKTRALITEDRNHAL